MTVAVTAQLAALSGAVLLGLGLGLFYDLLRTIRVLLRIRALSILLDLAFWIAATAVLFVWSVAAGDGQVQLSVCLFLFLGAVFYFHLVSPWLFPILRRLARLLRRFFHAITAPVRWIARKSAGGAKKIFIFSKKLFSSAHK